MTAERSSGRRRARRVVPVLLLGLALAGVAAAPVAALPFTSNGTQPPISKALRDAADCAGCHGDYDPARHYEPHPTWAGSPMALAGRDPLFWAALDVANHDVPGIGDFCLRCHSPDGWLAGRVQPPGGSFDGCLLDGQIDRAGRDFDGVSCHFCHRMFVNPAPPAGQEPVYLENGQFWVDDGACASAGGSGGQPCRRGPYHYPTDGTDQPPHPWLESTYHEQSAICGNCHNVTSPALTLIDGGVDTGVPFPIERTYDEWLRSDFSDPTAAAFRTCQGCHMPQAAVSPAYACDSRRNDHSGDLAIHELVGGNTWIPFVIEQLYPTLGQSASLLAAVSAALDMLQLRSALVEVSAPPSAARGGTVAVGVRVTNLTGHKLPTGYPEGRRMWLQVVATGADGVPFFESGAYDFASGELSHDAQLKVYEVEPGVWNHRGAGTCDVVDAGGSPMFHFALNNCIRKDNRIPPQGFDAADDLELRPVAYAYPETAPGSGVSVHWDDTTYQVPVPVGVVGPISVTATLWYQTASREYVTFLRDQAVTHGFPDDCLPRAAGLPTQSRGELLYALWEAYGRSEPVDMAGDAVSVTLSTAACGDGTLDPGEGCDPGIPAGAPGACPTACDDGDPCTTDTLVGGGTCAAACQHAPITACAGGDGCCPAGCDATTDGDCEPPCPPPSAAARRRSSGGALPRRCDPRGQRSTAGGRSTGAAPRSGSARPPARPPHDDAPDRAPGAALAPAPPCTAPASARLLGPCDRPGTGPRRA